MSLVVSQIETLRAKVISPSGFCRADIPNPNALQDIMLHSQNDGGANDLCIDLGYCSYNAHIEQHQYLTDMITNYHQNIFNGNEEEDSKTVKHNIDSIVPPGFEPVKIKGGTKGEGKETTDAKIKM